jgi:hypothetical protein
MEALLTARRLLVGAAALVALVAVTSGCGGGADAQAAGKHDPAPVEYSSSLLSFSHPAAWKAYTFPDTGELHFHPLVYLTNQPAHDPCSTQGDTTSCGFPVKRLVPHGVLALWQPSEFPVTGPVKLGGTRIRVDGYPAGRTETAKGQCRSIGADRTIQVVSEVRHQSLITFTACLRGPGLARTERQIDALLASTKFH